MVNVNSCGCAGQSSLFDVVIVDRLGKRQETLGRGLLQSGAVSQAAGYNAGNSSGLVAIVLPADEAGPTIFVEPEQTGQAKENATRDRAFSAARRLMITTGAAKQFLLPLFCDDCDLEYYQDLLSDAEQVDIVEDCQVDQPEETPQPKPAEGHASEFPRDLACEVSLWEMKLHNLFNNGWRPNSVQDVARISYSLEQLCGVITKRNGIERDQMESDWQTGHSFGSHFPAFDKPMGVCCVQHDVEETEASSIDSDAFDEQDDSDVDQGAEDAADDELEGPLYDDVDFNLQQALYGMVDDAQAAANAGDLSEMASLGVRYTLCRYLGSVIQVVLANKVRCASDIGYIAKGLERFCAQIIDGDENEKDFHDWRSEGFDDGHAGNVSNDYGTTEALSEWLDAMMQVPA